MTSNHDVEALETLTSTLTDSINGYEEAAEVADNYGISSYLRQKAQERRAITDTFRQKIASLGGDSKVSGSVSAALHRRFMDLRSMFQNDTRAAIAEVERGESYLKERFETYISDQKLTSQTRDLLRSTYERVRFDHAKWDQLKRAHETSRSAGSRRSPYAGSGLSSSPYSGDRLRRSHAYGDDQGWTSFADTVTIGGVAVGAALGFLGGYLTARSDNLSSVSWPNHRQTRSRISRDRRSQRPRSIETDETIDLIASNKVEGTAVYDRQGNKLGEVKNFMVGKRSGRVAYAVMSFGGLLGMGSSHYPLPWSALDYDTEKGGYVVDLDKDRLKDAPSYPAGENGFTEPGYGRRVTQYWIYTGGSPSFR